MEVWYNKRIQINRANRHEKRKRLLHHKLPNEFLLRNLWYNKRIQINRANRREERTSL